MTTKLECAIIWASWLGSVLSQQCYYDKGKKTDPRVTNCTSTEGVLSLCCFSGHICLEEAACFDSESKTTYLYGCTDPDYLDGRCPVKWGFNMDASPWVAVTKNGCNTAKDMWVGVHPDSCGSNCSSAPWGPVPFAFPDMDCSKIKPKKVAFDKTLNSPLKTTATAQVYRRPTPKPSIVTPNDPVIWTTTVQTLIETAVETAIHNDAHTIVNTSLQTTMQTALQTVTVVIGPSGVSDQSSDVTTAAAEGAALPDEKKRTIGISVGIGAAAVLALLAVGGFLYRRRRQKARSSPPGSNWAPGKRFNAMSDPLSHTQSVPGPRDASLRQPNRDADGYFVGMNSGSPGRSNLSFPDYRDKDTGPKSQGTSSNPPSYEHSPYSYGGEGSQPTRETEETQRTQWQPNSFLTEGDEYPDNISLPDLGGESAVRSNTKPAGERRGPVNHRVNASLPPSQIRNQLQARQRPPNRSEDNGDETSFLDTQLRVGPQGMMRKKDSRN